MNLPEVIESISSAKLSTVYNFCHIVIINHRGVGYPLPRGEGRVPATPPQRNAQSKDDIRIKDNLRT